MYIEKEREECVHDYRSESRLISCEEVFFGYGLMEGAGE